MIARSLKDRREVQARIFCGLLSYRPECKDERLPREPDPLLCQVPGVIRRTVHFERGVADEQCGIIAGQHRFDVRSLGVELARSAPESLEQNTRQCCRG